MNVAPRLVVFAFFALFAFDAPAAQPNILFIYLDDFGWKDAGYMGSDFYETPHLDQLAAEGMVFTNAYSSAANCAPARASLLSGQYAPRHRIFNVGTGPRGNAKHRRLEHIAGTDVLDPGIRTWAQQLQDAGYTTAIMGKWHLSEDPLPYGFDVNIGGTHSGSPPRGYYPPHPRAPGLTDAADDEYLTDRLSDEAVSFIRSHHEKPWMLYLSHFAVHTPLDAKRELLAKYETKTPGALHRHATMATMIQAVDDGIGRIQAALQELGIAENTVVLFSSDNGGYGPATDMAPLKGYKGTYYEGGIRVPLFVKWPGTVAPGGRNEAPVIGVDFYPTICAIAGVPLPAQPLDGVSLVDAFSGDNSALRDRPLFWHFPAYLQSYASVADEQRDPLFRSRPCGIVRLGDWKLHQYFEGNGLELYNLREDVGEARNVAEAYPEKAQELLTLMEGWRGTTGAPVPTASNPQFDPGTEEAAIAAALSTTHSD